MAGVVCVCAPPIAAQEEGGATADFNGDGAVDLADYELLQAALDLTYDLTGDGRVDLRDFLAFGEQFEQGLVGLGDGDDADGEPEPPPYQVLATDDAVALATPHYSAVVQRGGPFGITSLRLHGQPVDFVCPDFSLADWEWIWFWDPQAPGGRAGAKVLDVKWNMPTLTEGDDFVELTYERRHLPRPGIHLTTQYRFSAARPEICATYSFENQSRQTLVSPYAMVGLPGFADHRWVTEVADARQRRVPLVPNRTFWQEALADGRAEYLLLRHDVSPKDPADMLKSRVAIRTPERVYEVQSYCQPGPGVTQLYSAHTNKPGYLTSHLYISFSHLPDGLSHSISVVHSLVQE
ncbi:hypothetical protein ACFL6X_04655 [Candidatus Latescibacterota bacterium]